MLRSNSIAKYEIVIRDGLQELFNVCKQNMSHTGDLLLCQQNGHIGFGGLPCVGLGNDGLNNMQKINSISYMGIGGSIDDDSYFTKHGNSFLSGASDFERGIFREKSTYLDIWENTYFLRIFTQIVNVLNGHDYDWNLEMTKLPPNGKSKHIREQIISRLNLSPKFQKAVRTAYVGQIRNAIAHTQYHCIQGGIMYDNYGCDKYSTLQGLSYEQWEEKYIYSYFIFCGLFQILKQINEEFYLPTSRATLSGGIPVKIPCGEKEWAMTYLYPNEKGDTWRFTKTK